MLRRPPGKGPAGFSGRCPNSLPQATASPLLRTRTLSFQKLLSWDHTVREQLLVTEVLFHWPGQGLAYLSSVPF